MSPQQSKALPRGKEGITIRCFITTSFQYWGQWSPRSFFEPSDRMVAGGESAMVHLSVQLAKRGHEVMLFYDVDRPQHYKGVDFLPKSYARQLIPSMKGDILISWEDLESISWNHKCDLVVFSMQTNSMEMLSRDIGVDYYQAVSNWHVNTLWESDRSLPESSRSKFVIFPNGVNLERYAQDIERIPGRVIYSSSPDRGLHHLLKIWPQVKAAVPHASLRIFYDMKKWMDIVDYEYGRGYMLNTSQRAFDVRRLLQETADLDVVHVGPVGQYRLAQEQLAAELMCYPCDTIDHKTEGFGISVLEAMAAGTPVLTSAEDAFPELWTGYAKLLPMPIEGNEHEWASTIIRFLTDKKGIWTKYHNLGLEKAQTLTWETVGGQYECWLRNALEAKKKQEVLVA